VRRRGFTCWSIGPELAVIQEGVRNRPRPDGASEAEEMVGNGLAMFAHPAVERARDLFRLTSAWPPDLVVREIYELGVDHVAPDAVHVRHGLGAHFPGFAALVELARAEVARRLGRPVPARAVAQTPYLDPFPALLQVPPEDQGKVLPIRPHAGEVLPGEELPVAFRRLPRDRTVYLTLGTFFNEGPALHELVAAVSELDVNVAVTTGAGVDPSSWPPLPPQVAVAPFVPQALLLPHCAAVVSHGGAGTLLGGLIHGLPQVCLPRGADQFVNAEQLARVGARITLGPAEATPDAIRTAVSQVLTHPGHATAAARVQSAIAAMPHPTSVLRTLTAAVADRPAGR
jgi:UDP:flavonoid glycosyltransferase YjiC (YdhE family)